MQEISTYDSKVIDLLRFPLALLVIFVHMHPETISFDEAWFPLLSGQGVINAIEISFSRLFGRVAVPTFFLISGYLFWNHQEQWNWSAYCHKLISRSRSLLLPYILWILIAVLSYVIYNMCLSGFDGGCAYLKSLDWRIFWDSRQWGGHQVNWLNTPLEFSGPFVDTFWYLRDLMVVSILAPLFFYFFYKFKWVGLVLLFLCYNSRIWPQIHGFEIDAFFFFGAGFFLAMQKLSLTETCFRISIPIYCLALVSFLICLYYGGQDGDVKNKIGQTILPLFITSCVISFVNIANYLVRKRGVLPNQLLVSSCFFIYAFHACPLAGIQTITFAIRDGLEQIFPHLPVARLIVYIATPCITLSFCFTLYYLLQRWLPAICSPLSGNRLYKKNTIK